MFRVLILTILLASPVLNCDSCGENASVDLCGRSCEPRCKQRDFSAVQCLQCSKRTKGCRCNEPFLRDEKTGACVDAQYCSTCDTGEIREACGRICEGNCTHPYQPEICQRIRCANMGCRCDLNAGYVRDEYGHCVLKEQCNLQ